MTGKNFDLIVIGGGPGGYTAAIRASQLGLKVAIIEREALGGICLNWGCIPTKALLRSSEIYHQLNNLSAFGLAADNPRFDFKALVARSRKVAGQLNAGVIYLMKKNKITVFEGDASFTGPHALEVGDESLAAKNIIIATGARARELPHLKADGKVIWTYRHAMTPEEMPAKLLVIGSGAIGIEFASFYSDLGAEVTVVEMLERILPVEDEEISALARKAFEKQGMKIITSASVAGVKITGEGKSQGIEATIESGGKKDIQKFDRAILAIGVTGNVEGLGLDGIGVVTGPGGIITVNGWGETKVSGVWAIGDVAGPPLLAHKAAHEGVIAVEKMAGIKGLHPLDKGNVPGCTYSRPQIASVGLTEAAAQAEGRKVRVGKYPFMGNGKAIALGEPEGLVKVIFDAGSGELLGAHMIGAEVTEMIQGFAIARTLETTEAELMQTIFPHPTLSEMMHESVLAAYGKALNI